MVYAQLHSTSNYSFLIGASHPYELVARAAELGYEAIALADECSLAGVVKAHQAAKIHGIQLLIGTFLVLSNGCRMVVLAPDKAAYRELSGYITLARRRAPKGTYQAHWADLRFRLRHCLIIWLPQTPEDCQQPWAEGLAKVFAGRLWLGIDHQLAAAEQLNYLRYAQWAQSLAVPMVACPRALMHEKQRKVLQDVLSAIKANQTVQSMGQALQGNAEAYLKSLPQLSELYPPALLQASGQIAARCQFSLDELRYQYPKELVPESLTPSAHLRALVARGERQRWPEGTPPEIARQIINELTLIQELSYEYYFLTVYDIVQFARRQKIFCQGRGSAANSVICYCLFITEISPEKIQVLFERFISKERDEPPDIDVDFEHERREEVIQYIYGKYSRERAALAATVITYRTRSALRDVGKALGFELDVIEGLGQSLAWWDRKHVLAERLRTLGLSSQEPRVEYWLALVEQIQGFPRHLSQHVGGFIIAEHKVSDIVPLENAAMPERTIIQWDKEDLESLGLLKVDVLALGMLSAIRKAFEMVQVYEPQVRSVADIPEEDKATYDMLCRGDSVGVFQVESRAQMAMLPRLRPRCFYDLVIEIAIVRPGPIQGDMVHPFLRRRDQLEPVEYPSEAVREVLQRTMGVPIFQEQVIRLAMVAAGFTGGEADQLRRAMANWGKNSRLLDFEQQFVEGMLANGYSLQWAQRLFEQIKGFGGYGFPESHSASFALLAYTSAWLKCHHPAAFYAALLNSLPMGFYSASQLLQDAQRHGIVVHPVAINHSQWLNTLCAEPEAAHPWGIRLGFSQVQGMAQDVANKIFQARQSGLFSSVDNCAQRTGLTASELELLASADALSELAGNRHQARWQAADTLHNRAELRSKEIPQDDLLTAPPTLAKDVLDDYQTTGLSLKCHPLALLRQTAPFDRCSLASELPQLSHGRFVRVAGLVTGRQRPGTAKGTVFLTLEDETGNINVVVWSSTQAHFRQTLLTSQLLVVEGRLEVSQGVTHVLAGKLIDATTHLNGLVVQSRDFH